MYQIIYHFVLDQFLKGFDFRQSYKLLQSTPTGISRKVVWVVTAIIGSGGIHAIVGILEMNNLSMYWDNINDKIQTRRRTQNACNAI